jgi:flavorubredoxin
MHARELCEGIHWVGAVDWDRRLFDTLIPIPEGTSYNAWVVRGSEKTALIDTVEPDFWEKLSGRLDHLDAKIDIVVSNHAEQDHSGCLPNVLARFPAARLVCTARAKNLLLDHLDIPEDRIDPVADGDTIDLGGKSLRFIHFPWVHWPETMLTWVEEDRVLFPCDLFGAHLATNELVATDSDRLLRAAKLYYAQIMMPFRDKIATNLARLDGLDIGTIAPSHGPAIGNPKLILDAYRDWVGDRLDNVVVLPFISMHDSTRRMVDHLIDALTTRGVRVERINLETIDLDALAVALVDAATVVFGTPTFLMAAHPNVVHAANLTALLKPKLRHAAVIGSFAWGGKSVDQVQSTLGALKGVTFFDAVLTRGTPNADARAGLERLADSIAEAHESCCKPRVS